MDDPRWSALGVIAGIVFALGGLGGVVLGGLSAQVGWVNIAIGVGWAIICARQWRRRTGH